MKKLLLIAFLLFSAQVSRASVFFIAGTTSGIVGIDSAAIRALTGNFTLMAWTNVAGVASSRCVMDTSTAATATGFSMVARNNGGTPIWNFTTKGIADYNFTGYAIPLNTWNHMAVTYDGTNHASLYINGVFIQTITGGVSGMNASVTTALIGYFNNGGSYVGFSGLLDDVRLYNRIVTAQEIESIGKSRARIAITDGLLGWWQLNDGEENVRTTTIIDRSNNGVTGHSLLGPLWKASEVPSR